MLTNKTVHEYCIVHTGKLTTTQKSKQHKIQQKKTTLVQSPCMTLGQETRWVSTTLRAHTGLLHGY